jgi:SAM-dependent methyltransferase
MYDPERVRAFYNDYGVREWERLDLSAHARLVKHLHLHFLQDHIGAGTRVLDAGCGAGRFSVHIARSGSRVTLYDISDEQIALAKGRFAELGLLDASHGFLVGDICDLACFSDHTFDTTVVFGGALNYLFENAPLAARELVRVTKPGGTLLTSVMSRWGVIRFTVAHEELDPVEFFGRPDYWMIPQVAETGDLGAIPEVKQPPRHFFDSFELTALLTKAGLEDLRLGAAPSLSAALYSRLDLIEQSPSAWQTLLDLEEKAYTSPGLADSGEFLLAKGKVPSVSSF